MKDSINNSKWQQNVSYMITLDSTELMADWKKYIVLSRASLGDTRLYLFKARKNNGGTHWSKLKSTHIRDLSEQ